MASQVYKSGIALAQREAQIVMLQNKLKWVSFKLQVKWGKMAGDDLLVLSAYFSSHY